MKKRFLILCFVLLAGLVTACSQKPKSQEVTNPNKEQGNNEELNTSGNPSITTEPSEIPNKNINIPTTTPYKEEHNKEDNHMDDKSDQESKMEDDKKENASEDKNSVNSDQDKENSRAEDIKKGTKGWVSEDKTKVCIDDEGTILTFMIKEGEVLITGLETPPKNELIIPESIESYPVTAIEEYAFYNTSITKLVLPEGLKVIKSRAFQKCYELKEISFPSSLEVIEQSAFGICPALETMTLPKENKHYTITDGVLYTKDKNTLVKYPSGSEVKEYTILKSVNRIAEGAFSLAKKLTRVELPDKLSVIENEAFSGCIQLSFELTPNITKIGDYAFSDCYSITELRLPDSLTYLGEGAFSACEKLESVIIPKKLTRIPFAAFTSNTSLTEVVFLGSIATIEDMSFSSCQSLTYIDIPIGTIHIGDMAFYACTNLEEITIPDTTVSFGNEIFGEVSNLVIVTPKNSTAETYAKENGFGYQEAVVDIIE